MFRVLCIHCTLNAQKHKINELKSMVKLLMNKLTALKQTPTSEASSIQVTDPLYLPLLIQNQLPA